MISLTSVKKEMSRGTGMCLYSDTTKKRWPQWLYKTGEVSHYASQPSPTWPGALPPDLQTPVIGSRSALAMSPSRAFCPPHCLQPGDAPVTLYPWQSTLQLVVTQVEAANRSFFDRRTGRLPRQQVMQWTDLHTTQHHWTEFRVPDASRWI